MTPRPGRSQAFLTGLLLVSAALAGCERPGDLEGPAQVIDGDTVAIGADHIRLVGIDAPEKGQTCLDGEGRVYACGASAARALADLAGSASLTCRRQGTDDFKRALATCFVGGDDIQAAMVRQGWAVAFIRYSDAYTREEAEARTARRGLWAGSFVPPSEFRLCLREGGTTPACSRGDEAPASRPPASGSAPPGCAIKGNVNGKGEQIYHRPSDADYERVVIRTDKGERWFCTEDEAREAGWRPPAR